MSKLTQKAIMNAFLEILKYKTLDKITVKDIIESTEINRNTFYYYYEDIYDLLDHIFNAEIEKVLSETPENASFYEEYIRAASILINNRQAIIHIYNSKSRMLLFTYLETVTNVFGITKHRFSGFQKSRKPMFCKLNTCFSGFLDFLDFRGAAMGPENLKNREINKRNCNWHYKT